MFARIAAAASRRQNGWMGIIVPGAYAALVIAVTLATLAVLVFSEDPGFAGVWLILATLPLSALPLAAVPQMDGLPSLLGDLIFFLQTTGAGLVQAWLLHLVIRGPRVPAGGASQTRSGTG